jgi:hypothetical protein
MMAVIAFLALAAAIALGMAAVAWRLRCETRVSEMKNGRQPGARFVVDCGRFDQADIANAVQASIIGRR